MADGIDAGAFLEYELGIQVMRDDGTDSFEGIDLLDPTKFVPEELVPVQLVGKLTLNRNPVNQRPAAAGPAVLLPGPRS
jgi:catalase